MRILHVVTAFPQTADDVITPWLVELLKRLKNAHLDVEVFTSAYKGASDHVLDGIPVHRYRYFLRAWENLTHEETAPDRMRRSILYRLMPVPFVLAGMLSIWRLCRRRRYDIVHIHWPVPLALFGRVAQAACGARLVMTFYGAELRLMHSFPPLLKWFVSWAATRADRVVAISTATANEVEGLANVAVEVIPYTSGVVAPSSDATRPTAAKPFTILFVGRLVERKGVVHLIDALATVSDALQAHLVIVGDGPERNRLEQRAQQVGVADRVSFAGRISDAELTATYEGAGVFVLPSVRDVRGDTEGLGVVLLDAMQVRVPVIGSDIGGITDIVIHEKTGLLVPPGDASALAAAIMRVAHDRALARRLAYAGHRHLQEHFSWSAIVDRWLDLYRNLTSRPGDGTAADPPADRPRA